MHALSLSLLPLLSLLLPLLPLPSARAATADQWRSRSIYQVITDRFALPDPSTPNLLTPPNPECNTMDQTWCGGTWASITANLDYIQDMGFTAVWISPVSENYDGPRTPYGDAYHGYWTQNLTALNPRYGTAADLKALSDALHSRGMYLMVDVVVNNVITLNYTNPDYSKLRFQQPDMFHPYCQPIDYNNQTSVEQCWLGDTVVALMDMNTEHPTVISTANEWIASLVEEFAIDGLRIDAAKHVRKDFWPGFCGNASVFCIGEVDIGDVGYAAAYQGDSLDSVLDYPGYYMLVDMFAIPGARNVSALTTGIQQGQALYKDMSVLGTFLENQDNPRWANISVDPQTLWNALVWQFVGGQGIPIAYYGQEQGMHGNSDPMNREPLWPSNYANTTTVQLYTTLNKLRTFLATRAPDFLSTPPTLLGTTASEIAFARGPLVGVVTNRGSVPVNATMGVFGAGFEANQPLTEILTCDQVVTGSQGSLLVDYSSGGHAAIYMRTSDLTGSGICSAYTTPAPVLNSNSEHNGASSVRPSGSIMLPVLVALLAAALCAL